MLVKSSYSYFQYHWCPITLIVSSGFSASSIRYSNCRDGIARNIKIILGIIVQISSLLCASFIFRFMSLFKSIKSSEYLIMIIIINMVIITESWKYVNIDIVGEIGSWESSWVQYLISKWIIIYLFLVNR